MVANRAPQYLHNGSSVDVAAPHIGQLSVSAFIDVFYQFGPARSLEFSFCGSCHGNLSQAGLRVNAYAILSANSTPVPIELNQRTSRLIPRRPELRAQKMSVLDEAFHGLEQMPELISVMAGSNIAAVLAIDIGTSGVRASLFDEYGHEVDGASVRVQQPLSENGDFALTDAESGFELVRQTIDALLEQTNQHTVQIQLIAICCFWHSLMGVDAQGSPTTPVFGWADTGSATAVKELRSRFDESAVHTRTGCRFHPSYWPAKLVFLKDTQPQAVAATSRWLSFGEYVVLRLSGEIAASVSMASGTGLFNQRLLNWDRELIDALGIAEETLPEISHLGQPHCNVRAEYAARWPSLTEARICLPIGDGAANTIGSGCTTRQQAALMIGTSGAMRVLYEGEPPDELPASLWCYRADSKRVIIGGALSDGGGLHQWIRESLMPIEGEESIEAALDMLEPDAHGLTVLPFWAGERSTGWSTEARGAIFGLTLRTRPVEILRAAMEAIAYRFALIAQDINRLAPNATIIASGTALRRSPVWAQIVADVLGRSVELSEPGEASVRGAALLALEGAGKIKSLASSPLRAERIFEPDMSRHRQYGQGLQRQQRMYERLIESP
jgi:gluconokinase